MNTFKRHESGFTIIETLVALGVFSVILFIISVGFVQVTKVYQQGISSRSTQQASRFIMDEISKSVRGTSSIVIETNAGLEYLCLDKTQFVYNPSDYSLLKRKLNDKACSDFDPSQVNNSGTEYLVDSSSKLAVRTFSVSAFHADNNGDPRSVEVDLRITTRNDLVSPSGQCDASRKGVEYCSSTSLSSIFSLRKSTKKNTPDFSRDSNNTVGSLPTPPSNSITVAGTDNFSFKDDDHEEDFNVSSGNNRLLVVAIAAERSGNQYVSSIKYGDSSLTRLTRRNLNQDSNTSCADTANQVAEVWYLSDPQVGGDELKIEWGGGNPSTSVGVIQFNNASTPGNNVSYEENCTANVSSNNSGGQLGSYSIGVVSIGDSRNITPAAGQSKIFEQDYTGGGTLGVSYKELTVSDIAGFSMGESFSSQANRAIYLNFIINPQ